MGSGPWTSTDVPLAAPLPETSDLSSLQCICRPPWLDCRRLGTFVVLLLRLLLHMSQWIVLRVARGNPKGDVGRLHEQSQFGNFRIDAEETGNCTARRMDSTAARMRPCCRSLPREGSVYY